MSTYIFYALLIWMVIILMIVYIEVKKAPLINDDDISLFDDEEKTPAEKYDTIFCQHCLKKIDGFCNNGVKFRKIDDEMINICKKEKFFEPK